MNCEQFTHQVGADPNAISSAVREHIGSCQRCNELLRELQAFDTTLKVALDVDVPDGLGVVQGAKDNVVELQSRSDASLVAKRPQWLAVAAVVVLGIGVSVGIWYKSITAPLPQSLVAHVRHEPQLLGQNWSVVPAAQVEQVLSKGRVSLNGDIGTVRHAGLCYFRGNKVAHVVVHTTTGPVTVMLLPDVPLQNAVTFEEDGLQGLMVPIGKGSIAVLGDDSEALPNVRQRVAANVAWSI
ncbi:MAG: DUF3379 family protein [Gammaproteobacteria bacterium]|nr:DUF3379 family protein [Gammaproteobacteria bacterium]